jgi:hypothetical protein
LPAGKGIRLLRRNKDASKCIGLKKELGEWGYLVNERVKMKNELS